MRNRKLNSITYGALICALVGALLLVNRQFGGFLDTYLFWIIPIPVIIYSLKFGTKQTLVMIVSMTLLSFVLGGMITTFYVFGACLAGVVYGDGLNRGKSATYLICSVIVISLIMMIISTYVFAAAFGYASLAEDIEFFSQTFADVLSKRGIDITNPTIAQILSKNMMATILIIASIITSVLEGILVHIVAFLVLKRLKMQLPPMKPLGTIYAPFWVKIIVFVGFFAFWISKLTSVSQYDNIVLPVLVVAECLSFAFGYIFIMTLASIRIGSNKKKSMGLTSILMILMVISPMIFVFAGVFDIFSPFRRRLVEEVTKNAKQDGQV